MSIDPHAHTGGDAAQYEDEHVDKTISCGDCDAVCCRLTVLVMPDDDVPRHMVERSDEGLEVMARDEDGWCVAIDHQRMCCGIYGQRPAICRKFAMGSAYCRDERERYRHRFDRDIPLLLC